MTCRRALVEKAAVVVGELKVRHATLERASADSVRDEDIVVVSKDVRGCALRFQ